MPTNILMPALSPTMEKGNLAKWIKKEGDKVAPGDVLAEIETDKATMEVEAVDEGTIAKILVPEGTQDVPVNDIIAVLAGDGEDVRAAGAGAAAAGVAAGAGAAFGADVAPAPAAFTSSPSPAKTAMISLTGTSCVPSGTRIFAIVPSSTASTSIVALSVSISAITSPDLTLSPSFLSHLARFPFSIVGDSAGIKMLIGIVSDLVATGAWWSPYRSAG